MITHKEIESNLVNYYSERKKFKSKLYLPCLQNNLISQNILTLNLADLIRKIYKVNELSNLKLIDFGCGNGSKDLIFLSLGLKPVNFYGVEVHPSLFEEAKENLPNKSNLFNNSIIDFPIKTCFADIGFQSMALSSITNKKYFNKTCTKISKLIKPDGILFSYDFIYTNPNNKNVIPLKKTLLKKSFPDFKIINERSLTLAPPISRILNKFNPVLHELLERLFLFNTHRLYTLKKLY